jgi:ribonuclease HI
MTIHALIYTDGSCLGNPGPGGYAALIVTHEGEQEITGNEPDTTNNRMELLAAISALEALPTALPATIFSDSEYVVKGMNEWVTKWKAKGWRTAQKKAVANVDLWQRLDELVSTRTEKTRWQWVRGHDGHAENERVDQLASEQAALAAASV